MKILAIFKKEMKDYFNSPLAYLVIALFIMALSFLFYSRLYFYSMMSQQAMRNQMMMQNLDSLDYVIKPLFGNIVFLFLIIIPVLTMKLIAEEKKTKTIELLFTYPLKEIHLFLGKFLAAFAVAAIMILFCFPYIVIIWKYLPPDWGPIITGIIGTMLMTIAFVSVGLWASSTTENQITSFVLAFCILLGFWIIGWAESFAPGFLGTVSKQLSIIEHFNSFSQGVLDTHDIIYYICFSAFFIFLTFKSLEVRKWRG